MREILFRAKRLDNGEWAEAMSIAKNEMMDGGSVWFIGAGQPASQWTNEHGNMVSVETTGECLFYACDHKTIGQFTGLTDKNGTKIFEGDIVHVHDRLLRCDKPYHEFDGVIEHKDGSFVIVGEVMTHYRWLDYDVTVLGNIHDNPELLEV